jgi:predicted phosphohydrolase
VSEDPKRLLVTADLHFGLCPAGDACTLRLAEHVHRSGADAFAIAGDVADADTESFRACLDLFAQFKGLKLLVPGNHDLWTAGVGSLKKYRQILPALATDCGFRMLDSAPVVADRTGFIGSIGWYDYSFRNPALNISMENYSNNELPGVCTWNDVQFIDWELTDEEFTDKCLRKLKAAYRSIEPRVHTVVVLLHHLPFRELLYGPSSLAYEFCRAFMGSDRLGKILLDCPKVRYAFCGHTHAASACKAGRIEAVSVGSNYVSKRLVELDLTTGQHTAHEFTGEPAASKTRTQA